MSYLAKNNASSTLAGAILATDTSITVQVGQGDRFPVVVAPDYSFITFEDSVGNIEIVKITARAAAADTMTIVRAQESTTAKAYPSGTIVSLRPTAGLFQQIFNHIANTIGAHLASVISNAPAGSLVSTDVQSAINELDSKKASIAFASNAPPNNGIVVYNAVNTTLNASDFGRAIYANTTINTAIALPTPTSGKLISITNINTGTVTITSATANIYAKGLVGVTSINLIQGESIQLISDGAIWIQINFSGESGIRPAFSAYQSTAQSLAQSVLAIVNCA